MIMPADLINSNTLKELGTLYNELNLCLRKEKSCNENDQDNNIGNEENDKINRNFDQLFEKIEKYLLASQNASEEYIKFLSMKASLLYEKAKYKISGELSADALLTLQSTLELVEKYADHDYIMFLYLRIVNHLSYLLSKEGRLEEARHLLENILNKEHRPNVVVYSTDDLFKMEEPDANICKLKFNKLMLNNLQMLGWIYGRLGFHDLHAYMEHKYLQKLLDMEDMSISQWTSKCCRLVIIYLTSNNWIYARYYLASIGALLSEKSSNTTSNNELLQAKASLSKAWIHYGLHLFSASKKKVLEQIYDNDNETNKNEEKMQFEVIEQHKFRGLEVIVPDVPTDFITITLEARSLFIHTQSWLKQMRAFYTLRDYPLQYVNAVLDLSELYRFLAFYETDLESQYNVQKRRSETLEALSTLLREVRPSCYTVVSVELWRELAEVQIELMGINLKRLYTFESESETAETIKKRIEAVSEVHDKLESIGDTIPSIQPKEAQDESQESHSPSGESCQ